MGESAKPGSPFFALFARSGAGPLALFSGPHLPRLTEIALPINFPPQPADRALSVRLGEQPQPGLDCGPFRWSSTAPHSLAYQLVINFNIRPHAQLLR
jgi:hypothetical protein